ncbi:unnamed protein product [Lactuca virosa]|uniref:Uncharacterized protein n=1 Tax=Lactuca virosa TaxID=75947 RepID=A0AAU9PR83_9ASTR|nr:unnamed protein product [Lactuca virosa]
MTPIPNEQPGGGGRDSNNTTTPEPSRIVLMNTKGGWTSLSMPARLMAARAHDMEKKETKEHTSKVTELDGRHEQGAVGTGEERIGNHLKKREHK